MTDTTDQSTQSEQPANEHEPGLLRRFLRRLGQGAPPRDSGPYAADNVFLDRKVRQLDNAFRERPPSDY